ncbi:MAG: putative peptide zinc metalloprotease protein [Actinomycetota bacterium]|jgi:putative peptide zinc metalloprotease protein
MTTTPARTKWARYFVAPLLAVALSLATAPPAAADKDDNAATAVNTEDGSSVFRWSLSVREVTDGVIDQTNTATAEASCVDCDTVAVAFQVILVSGDADVVVPENKAVAVNSECAECFTYASATQLVIGTDGKRLTKNGERRLKELDKKMREVERNADTMTEAEKLAAVQEAEQELVSIFEEELVPVDDQNNPDGSPSSSTTTSTTSTTTRSTSTTHASTTTTTTTTP